MFKLLIVAIVRPHLEYEAPIWNPDSKEQITLIESAQRRISNISHKERLEAVGLPTLQYRPWVYQHCSTGRGSTNTAVQAVGLLTLQYRPWVCQHCSTGRRSTNTAVQAVGLPTLQYRPWVYQHCSTGRGSTNTAVQAVGLPTLQYRP